MGKIYYMMGKSASGKDTLFKEVKQALPELRTITLYTTRSIREGERDGVEYFFVDDAALDCYEKQGKVVEQRAYNTVCGLWRYATVDDGQVDLDRADYLVIGTLESYEKMRGFYGEENLVPLYGSSRGCERSQKGPGKRAGAEGAKIREMCRRFLADEKDFSEENLARLGIRKRFSNRDKEKCLDEIIGEIRHGKF